MRTFLALILTLMSASAQNINIGVTGLQPQWDSGNAGLILAQSASLSQSATVQSLSFYVISVAGTLRLGLYDSTGSGGTPGNLLAQTGLITPVSGWNTGNVTPVTLAPGTYWLAYEVSDNAMQFLSAGPGPGPIALSPLGFGTFPSRFPLPGEQSYPTGAWSFYATLSLMPTPTPTPTPSPSPTASPTPTPTPGQGNASWSPPSAVAGYLLEYGTTQGGPYPNVIDAGLVYTYTITGLTSGTTYYFVTQSYDANRTLSCLSNEATFISP